MFQTIRIILIVLAFLGAIIGSIVTAPSANAATYKGPEWALTKHWEPCASDEGEGPRCVWHARRHGNGEGQSFIRTSKGGVIVIRHHDATILLRPLYAPRGA